MENIKNEIQIWKKELKFESYELENKPILKFYINWKLKKHIRFINCINRSKWILSIINDFKNIQNSKDEYKNKMKNEKINMWNNVKVWDIFVHSWWYEQTNVDFYQVIEKKWLKVKIKSIKWEYEEYVWHISWRVKPIKNKFNDNEPLNKILNWYWINFNYWWYARLWDWKESFYCSWYW